jgi:hypothetical protein
VGCPDATGKATCTSGSWELSAYVGGGLATKASAALSAPDAVRVEDPELGFRRHSFLIGTESEGFAFAFGLGLFPRTVFDSAGLVLSAPAAAQLTGEDILAGKMRIETEVNLLRIGPLEILTVPGEIYPELWLIKPDGSSYVERPAGADFPDAPIDPPLSSLLSRGSIPAIINQGNDALGYIIPKSQWDVDPPRAYKADGQYGEINSNGADTAPNIFIAVSEMLALTNP